MNRVIAVCEYGWILTGEKVKLYNGALILKNSSVVREWHNGKGIGGLAKKANVADYILDEVGDVEIMFDKILFIIPCEW